MIALPENVDLLLICRPSLMVTGFLGAGKTTFMRSLLVDLHRRQIAADVILNDYENAEIDAGTLRLLVTASPWGMRFVDEAGDDVLAGAGLR